ncbi:helix-turn-helix domain-containing protein [Muricoccus radiodurans]|uniref:helix-turn-helix domain-containing protein n=1 Tax=Muricoccus radiodurans TaxID=2231721 RepID=UPI003CE8F282
MAPATDTREAGLSRLTIDEHIGGRIRMRRMLLGLTQEKVAEALGLTFQQVQRFERGVNRMGASRLFDLSRVLDVPIAYFFDDMPEHLGGAATMDRRMAELSDDTEVEGAGNVPRKERREVLRAYCSISDPDVRKRVLELIRSLAE